MSLESHIDDLATSVATELKKTRVLVNNNAEDLNDLDTTAKSNLVAAINEVKLTADSAAGGGVAIDDDNVSTTTTYSSDKIVELDGVLQANIDALINDAATTSTTETWSANKITAELANVSVDLTELIDDETPSTTTVFSSTETEARIGAEVAALVDAAPGTLDTLNELAAALGDDPNFATTVSNDIGEKVSHAEVQTLDATSQGRARTNIGAASAADLTAFQTAVGDTEPSPTFAAIFTAGLV